MSDYGKSAGATFGSKNAAGRHPATALREFFPNSTYEVLAQNKGPGILNRFIVKLTIPSQKNKIFTGVAMTEKIAKHEAAVDALKFFDVPGCEKMLDHISEKNREKMVELKQFRSLVPQKRSLEGVEVDVVNYVCKLYGTDALFSDPVAISTGKASLFKATLTVQGYTFEELGPNKKKAKTAVAMTCIKALEPQTQKNNQSQKNDQSTKRKRPSNDKTYTFEDNLIGLVYKAMRDSTKRLSKEYLRLLSVAGIILLHGDEIKIENCEVIAVAAGANTIESNKLKGDGTAVHDCNAEMLAIRAFRTYLYDQLDKVIDGKDSVLERVKDSNFYKMKEQYKVIMAKNEPPAGDSLVVSHPSSKPYDRHLENNVQRTGVPGALQFAVPIIIEERQRGLKFVTQSFFKKNKIKKPFAACPSDKLTVCNIAGVQGALLSQLIQPVYIDKYLFHKSASVCPEALKRSFYGRVEAHIDDVPQPYKINKPSFATYSMKVPLDNKYGKFAGWMTCNPPRDWEVIKLPEGACITKTPGQVVQRSRYSNDISYYEKKLEIAMVVEGSMKPSQLCKRALFEQYKWINQKLNREIPDSYFACKALSTDYHAIKHSVNNAFNKAHLGKWPTKSLKTEHFS